MLLGVHVQLQRAGKIYPQGVENYPFAIHNDNHSHLMGWRIVASLAYSGTNHSLGRSMGLTATVGIHVLAVLGLLSSRAPEPAQLAPIAARVISMASLESARPQTIQAAPALQQPTLHTPLPDIAVADDAPLTAAPVSISSAAPRQMPVGQAVESQPRFDADYLDNPAPRYPPLSRRMREEGVVLVRVYVLPNGTPDVIELKKSSGSVRLDESALLAVKQWRFVPAVRAGEAIPAWVVVPVAFSLNA